MQVVERSRKQAAEGVEQRLERAAEEARSRPVKAGIHPRHSSESWNPVL